MYAQGKIDFAGNGRYYIMDENAKDEQAKNETDPIDATEKIRKYAKLRDDDIITEEEFQAKKKELLNL